MWHKERSLWVPERKLYYGFSVPGIVASQGGVAAPADIAFVQAGTPHTAGDAGSHTFGYTCAVSPGSNRLLVLSLATRYNQDTFDAVTYNSVAMSLAVSIRETTGTPDTYVGIWYLLHANIPNDGVSHNFFVDFTTEVRPIVATPLEYINVAQGAPHRTNSTTASGTGVNVNLTTVAAGALLVDAVAAAGALTTTAGANQNERGDAASTTLIMGGTSDKLPAAHAGGTVNMAQTLSGSTIKPYVAAAWEKAA